MSNGEEKMTVLIKYPRTTKLNVKYFTERKNEELTNLDWAKWAGWFDTDGSFSVNVKKANDYKCSLFLRSISSLIIFKNF